MVIGKIGDLLVGDIADISVGSATVLVSELGKIGLWLQAIGVVVVFWIILHIINLIYNFKKRNHLKSLEQRLIIIEKKIDKLSKHKKKK